MEMQNLDRLLNDEDLEVRREAVESLSGKPGDMYIRMLLRALEDMNWRVRNTAMDILIEEHPVDKFIEGLIHLLYLDDNAGARNSAIEALIRLNKKATPFLIEAFKTPNRDVRKFIIDVLGEYEDNRSLPLMLDALKDEDENVRATAIEHIGKVRESSVVDALIAILESDDIWTAYPAADALGRIGDRKAIPSLVKALHKKTLMGPAIKALSLIADPMTLQYIVPFLKYPSKTMQEETILGIERFYHKGVREEVITDAIKSLLGDKILETLIEHIWSQKPDVRISAILILGMMKDERALTPLLEVSQDENFREEVRRALVFIGKDRPESLLGLFEIDNAYQKRFLCEVAGIISSPVYFATFEKLLTDEDGHIRSLAAIAISRLGNHKAIEPLKRLLTDPYEDVQESAVRALSNLREGLSATELLDMLDEPIPLQRKNVTLLLGRIGAIEAIPALGFVLKDAHVSVRKAVIEAFSYLKTKESITFLILALTDEDPDIRALSALSLGSLGGEGSFEALSLILSDPDDAVKVAVTKALGMLKDTRAVTPLIKLLTDENGFVIATAIESLGKLGGDEARDALLRMLISEDLEIRRTAIKALSRFSDVDEALLPFLKDDDWATRVAAVEVLGKKAKGNIRRELERLLDVEEDPSVKKAVEESLDI
jgi:HEAT repeat protein